MSFEQDPKEGTSSSKILQARNQSDATVNARMDLRRVSMTVQSLNLEESEESVVVKKLQKHKCTKRQLNKQDTEEEDLKSDTRDTQDNCQSSVLRIISLDELAWHDRIDDCWLAVYDYVYDCTEFLKDHPGGLDVLLEYAGRDATLPFIGTGHSKFARQTLEKYLIGELPLNERIFRIPGGIKITGL